MIYDECLIEGIMENDRDEDKFYAKEEKELLKRLEKYKENYLMLTYNQEIQFSNNVSERSLWSSKTKMKVLDRVISKHTECKILCTDKKSRRNRKKWDKFNKAYGRSVKRRIYNNRTNERAR